MNRTKGIQAFLSLAVLAGIWKKALAAYRAATGWKRWAILLGAGAATGILIAIIIRALS